MNIDALDHLVLTVRDSRSTADFYRRVLGMEVITFGPGRVALRFGQQKINLHPVGQEFAPHAHAPTPGSADLCLITPTPLEQVIAQCQSLDVEIIEGPVARTGAMPGVEPTNNIAERALRPGVIWKHISFGAESQAGSEFVDRMLTTVASLTAQQRDVLDFLTQTYRAARLGQASPSLLPLPTDERETPLSS